MTDAVAQPRGTAIITGAGSARGIGRQLARRLAPEGWSLALIDRDAGQVAALAAELTDSHGTHTLGLGADVAFDAAGVGAVVSELFDILGARGHLEVVALHTEPYPLEIAARLMRFDRSIGSSLGYAVDHAEAIDLARSGRVRLGGFITSWIPAEDIVEKGFKRLLTDRDSEVKVLVHMR